MNQTMAASALRSTTKEILLWSAFLVLTSIGVSTALKCAVPFVAVAVAAALTMQRRRAYLTAGAAWMANQSIGFTVGGYPHTLSTLGWGVAIGTATLLAAAAASRFRGAPPAFAAGFVAYQLAIACADAVAGDFAGSTLAVIVRIFIDNALWGGAFLVAHRLLPLRRSTE
jgi:hypothetical protein